MSCDVEDTCVCSPDEVCFDHTCQSCPYCTPEMDEPDDDSAEESDFIEGMGFVPPEEFTRKHLAFDDLSNVKVFDWPDDPLTRRIE